MTDIRESAIVELQKLDAQIAEITKKKEEIMSFLKVYASLEGKALHGPAVAESKPKNKTSMVTKTILESIENILSDGIRRHTKTIVEELQRRNVPFGNWGGKPERNITSLMSRNPQRFDNDRALGWTLKQGNKIEGFDLI